MEVCKIASRCREEESLGNLGQLGAENRRDASVVVPSSSIHAHVKYEHMSPSPGR